MNNFDVFNMRISLFNLHNIYLYTYAYTSDGMIVQKT